MRYRREIDGLRALAVLAVILFHTGDKTFAGGFVGVDVFFVISGYLITTLIVEQTQNGTFKVAAFYERRARRILPALLLVMLACLPFAWLWLLPGDARDFAASVVAVCVFASNFLFWRESGYFGAAMDLKPLAHTWSLGVEEQYYLLYPPLLMLLWRLGKRHITGFFIVLTAISLAAAQWGSEYHPQAAFYLLPARMWELLLGALAALYDSHSARVGVGIGRTAALTREAAGLGGVLLIAFSVFSFDENPPVPGVYALIPTAGTLLVISFARSSTLAGRLLGCKPLVGLGLISYSAYLWHQPLFAFARHRLGGEPTEALLLGLSVLAIGLAFISWKYVEQPFRDRAAISRPVLLKSAGLVTAILLAIGLAGYASKGFSYRYAGEDRYLVELDPYAARAYVPERFTGLMLKHFDASKKKKILIIGDSYAEDLVNALFESGLDARLQLSTYLIPVACGNIFTRQDLTEKIRPADRSRCVQTGWYNNEQLVQLMRDADGIWLVSSWLPWQAALLPESVRHMEVTFGQKVLVFGDKDFGTFTVNDLLRVPAKARAHLQNPISVQHLEVNARMRSELPRDIFVDVSQLLCGNGTTCPLFTDDGKLITYDGGHLTREGARYYGQRLAQSAQIRRLLGMP